MKITKEAFFIRLLQALNVNAQVKTNRKTICAGAYKYDIKTNTIEKNTRESIFVGNSYEMAEKTVKFFISKTQGELRVINEDTKQLLVVFKHKTEPMVLV